MFVCLFLNLFSLVSIEGDSLYDDTHMYTSKYTKFRHQCPDPETESKSISYFRSLSSVDSLNTLLVSPLERNTLKIFVCFRFREINPKFRGMYVTEPSHFCLPPRHSSERDLGPSN